MPDYVHDNAKFESVQSEAAVLGSMIMDPECIPHVLAIITRTDMFFRKEHQQIFDAVVDLHLKSITIDAVALRDRLTAKNITLDQLDGAAAYIGRILDSVPTTANHAYYSKAVRDRAAYRDMFRVIEDIKRIPEDPGTVTEQITELHRLALSVQPEREDETHTFEDKMGQAIMNLIEDAGRISTGFTSIDKIIRGYLPGQLIVVAGRPNMGKTSLAMNSAMTLAKSGKHILFFSLEMTKDELMQRAACSVAEVDTSQWPLHGKPPQVEINALFEAANLIAGYPITLYDTVNTVQKMRALTDVHRRTEGVDLLIIDNLQIVATEPHLPKEYDRLSEISRILKRMAVELAVPVMLLSHLSREIDKRPSHRPTPSDLRGSGTIEQDANLVMFILREDVYDRRKNPDTPVSELPNAGAAQIIIAKNRGGRTGTANLVFREEYTLFRDLAQPEFEEA